MGGSISKLWSSNPKDGDQKSLKRRQSGASTTSVPAAAPVVPKRNKSPKKDPTLDSDAQEKAVTKYLELVNSTNEVCKSASQEVELAKEVTKDMEVPHNDGEEEAAVKIQAAFRGYKTRRQVAATVKTPETTPKKRGQAAQKQVRQPSPESDAVALKTWDLLEETKTALTENIKIPSPLVPSESESAALKTWDLLEEAKAGKNKKVLNASPHIALGTQEKETPTELLKELESKVKDTVASTKTPLTKTLSNVTNQSASHTVESVKSTATQKVEEVATKVKETVKTEAMKNDVARKILNSVVEPIPTADSNVVTQVKEKVKSELETGAVKACEMVQTSKNLITDSTQHVLKEAERMSVSSTSAISKAKEEMITEITSLESASKSVTREMTQLVSETMEESAVELTGKLITNEQTEMKSESQGSTVEKESGESSLVTELSNTLHKSPQNGIEPNIEAEIKGKPQTKPAMTSETKPDSIIESAASPEPSSDSKPKPASEPVPTSKAIETKIEPSLKLESEPLSRISDRTALESKQESENESKPNSETQNQPKSVVEPEKEPAQEREILNQQQPVTQLEAVKAESNQEPVKESEPECKIKNGCQKEKTCKKPCKGRCATANQSDDALPDISKDQKRILSGVEDVNGHQENECKIKENVKPQLTLQPDAIAELKEVDEKKKPVECKTESESKTTKTTVAVELCEAEKDTQVSIPEVSVVPTPQLDPETKGQSNNTDKNRAAITQTSSAQNNEAPSSEPEDSEIKPHVLLETALAENDSIPDVEPRQTSPEPEASGLFVPPQRQQRSVSPNPFGRRKKRGKKGKNAN